MFKLSKKAFLLATILCGLIGFANCSSTSTTNQNNGKTTVTTENKTTNTTVNTTANDMAKTDANAADKIGVPECDEYIQKYEACVNSKVPEAQRAMLKTSFEQQRKAFKDAAATPQGKAGLATGCKQALDTAKQMTTAYGCAW